MNETTKEISRLLELAIKAEDEKDVEQARQLYERCLALDDGSTLAVYPPASLPVRLKTLILYSMFLREHGGADDALAIALRAAERWPADGMTHLEVAQCLHALKRPTEAESAYRRSLAVEPKAWTWFLLGQLLSDCFEDRQREASECFHTTLALQPDYEEAHYELGCQLRRSGDPNGAIEHFRQALALDPDYAGAHAEFGFTHLALSQDAGEGANALLDIAVEHLERSVALNPDWVWSRLYLGVALWEAGRTRRARVHYEAAVALAPEDGFILSVSADFLSSAFGSNAEAERRFARAIELDPEHGRIRYFHGKHLHRTGRHSAARRELLLADRLGDELAMVFLKTVTASA